MSRDAPEFRLQCAIANHLRLAAAPGVYWTALPFGEFRAKRTAARLKAMGVRAGAPDILIIVHGRAYGLELKAEHGRQSPAQRLCEAEWTRAGGEYRIARGIDEALYLLREWGVLKPSYHYEPARRRQASLPLDKAEAA